MNNNPLNQEEKKILQDFESGKFKSVKHVQQEKVRYQESGKYTLKKTKNINIRLPERDLQHLKAIAAEEGLPYQTLISSLLHRYSTKRLGDGLSSRNLNPA